MNPPRFECQSDCEDYIELADKKIDQLKGEVTEIKADLMDASEINRDNIKELDKAKKRGIGCGMWNPVKLRCESAKDKELNRIKSLGVEGIRRIIIDEELIPSVDRDSGQAEWTVGESRKLATAIHNKLLKILGE